jgi:hypothetical protein
MSAAPRHTSVLRWRRYHLDLSLRPSHTTMLDRLWFGVGDVHGGIEEHLAALRILDTHPDAMLDRAITANSMGLAYFQLGNRPLAKEYFETAKL